MTPRQKEILQLIVQLYGQFEEPIGSKTLLKESLLKVSPATIRNDMVVLEHEGLLNKAHSSSGRIPSPAGYRYYVNRLILEDDFAEYNFDRSETFEKIIHDNTYDSLQMATLAVELLVSQTGYSGFVLNQNKNQHFFQEIKLVPLSENKIICILITDSGKSINQVLSFNVALSEEDLERISQLINSELFGSPLDICAQRLKLSIPLQIQKLVGYQLDFSSVVEQALLEVRTRNFKVSGKLNLFDLIESIRDVSTLKHIFYLIDGSKELFDLVDKGSNGINVVFGFELAPKTLSTISLVFYKYSVGNQHFTIGLVGPATMPYRQVIALMHKVASELANA